MSTRNYQAWLRAARKAAKKTGGLSLPAARKAYKKMAARVGRPLKGVDVSKHPRIFRDSLPAKNRSATRSIASGGFRKQAGAATRASAVSQRQRGGQGARRIPAATKPATRGGAVSGKAQPAGAKGLVVSSQSERMKPTEYVSTPEYTRLKDFSTLQVQIHIMGPSGMKKKQLDDIAEEWLSSGETPNGIEVRSIGWNGKRPVTDGRGMRKARSDFAYIPFTF